MYTHPDHKQLSVGHINIYLFRTYRLLKAIGYPLHKIKMNPQIKTFQEINTILKMSKDIIRIDRNVLIFTTKSQGEKNQFHLRQSNVIMVEKRRCN